MDRQEAISQLKDNREAFGLMNPALQNLAKEIGTQHFVWLCCTGTWSTKDGDHFTWNTVYRLRHDYTEQPEEIVCEVRPDSLGHNLILLHGNRGTSLGDAVGWIPQEGFRFDRAVFANGQHSHTGVTARVGDRTVHAVQVVYRKWTE